MATLARLVRRSTQTANHTLHGHMHGNIRSLSAEARAQASAKLDEEKVPTLREFLTLEDRKRARRSLQPYSIPQFDEFLAEREIALHRVETQVLQINIGLHCNQSCNHCHVESSPQRQEMMNRSTVDRLLYLLDKNSSVHTVDITGGAPELNREFRYLVQSVRALKPEMTIIDRCNLTVLYEDGQQDLKHFLAENRCKLICSLPCYSKKNVNRQRGKGVFDKSIQALLDLNAVGYGMQDERELEIDLVYNPLGGFLPPPRDALELDYKRELDELFGIRFNELHVFNNQPIKRFADYLYRRGELADYMALLVANFNPRAVDTLMCRNTVNVAWSGHVFDCDFNQMLEMPTKWPIDEPFTKWTQDENENENHDEQEASSKEKIECPHQGPTVFDFDDLNQFHGATIATDAHCYACTAGAGSKCGT
mmetsp:Transcript_27694/g.43865  ORF Transcript_27694/g.43865 Transcript_27694/m.43865 type:complete len:423 (+) Transcript_27694:46-1314(+)